MLASTIGKKYAMALFQAVEPNGYTAIEDAKNGLYRVVHLLNDNIMRVLKTPAAQRKDKLRILEEIAGKTSREVESLVKVLNDKKRLDYLGEIYKAFVLLYEEYKGIARADIIVPCLPDEKTKEKIALTLEKKFKKKFIFDFKVKKELLGGMVVKIGNNIIDGSLKNKLADVKNLLLR